MVRAAVAAKPKEEEEAGATFTHLAVMQMRM